MTDYSHLVGIYNVRRGNRDNAQRNKIRVFTRALVGSLLLARTPQLTSQDWRSRRREVLADSCLRCEQYKSTHQKHSAYFATEFRKHGSRGSVHLDVEIDEQSPNDRHPTLWCPLCLLRW